MLYIICYELSQVGDLNIDEKIITLKHKLRDTFKLYL